MSRKYTLLLYIPLRQWRSLSASIASCSFDLKRPLKVAVTNGSCFVAKREREGVYFFPWVSSILEFHFSSQALDGIILCYRVQSLSSGAGGQSC